MPNEKVALTEGAAVGAHMNSHLDEGVGFGRASALIQHRRLGPDGEWHAVGEDETVHNVITNAGRDYLHLQGYATSGLGTNGLNFIGLSNDTLTETVASTTLSNEITTLGLARAAGAYAHSAGTNTTTINRTFTASGTVSAQKAALFTAVSAGTMNHALAFTQRNLINGDTLAVTFTITLG
jgi:hypothetical protein